MPWLGRGTEALTPYKAKSAWDQRWWDGFGAGYAAWALSSAAVCALIWLAS